MSTMPTLGSCRFAVILVAIAVGHVGLSSSELRAQSTWYVDADANLVPDGSTWCNAFRNLQDALLVAVANDTILVANGTYTPTQQACSIDGDCDGGLPNTCSGTVCVWSEPRSRTFQLISGVEIKGGFAGCGAVDPNERDFTLHTSTLSGDISSDDNPGDFPDGASFSDNSYHVVTGTGEDNTAVVSGFTVEAGNANDFVSNDRGAGILGGSPTIEDCIIEGNYAELGAGAIFGVAEFPVIRRCTFRNNIADASGGGVRFAAGGGTVANCIFDSNSSTTSLGGALHANGADVTIINSIFYDNTSVGGAATFNSGASGVITGCTLTGNMSPASLGGGMGVFTGASVIVNNTILWANSDITGVTESGQIYADGATATVNYSIVDTGWSGDGGVGIIQSDPLFIWDAVDDYGLQFGSPAIDAGNSQAILADLADLDDDGNTLEPTPYDLDGNVRIYDDGTTIDTGIGDQPHVDLGAYEVSRDCNLNGIPDDQDLATCIIGTEVDCDDCNLNGIPDACDLQEGTSFDTNFDGIPDECVDWQGGATGDFSDGSNWPGGIVPDGDDSVTIDGSAAVTLDANTNVSTIRLLDSSSLDVNGSSGENLGTSEAILMGQMLVNNGRTVDASAGTVMVGPGGTITDEAIGIARATQEASSGFILANTLLLHPGNCIEMTDGGSVTLSGTMSATVSGDLRVVGPPDPTCGGSDPSPSLVLADAATLAVGGSLYFDLGATSSNTSTGNVTLDGSFANRSTHPSMIDWSNGRLVLAGSSPQTFEVGGIDMGLISPGSVTNEDALHDPDPHLNYAIGMIEIDSAGHVTFKNQYANAAGLGACVEALYVDTLVLGSGASVTLDDVRVYYNTLSDGGATISTLGCGELVEVADNAIPAVSTWGLVVLTLLILTAGTVVVGGHARRARATRAW